MAYRYSCDKTLWYCFLFSAGCLQKQQCSISIVRIMERHQYITSQRRIIDEAVSLTNDLLIHRASLHYQSHCTVVRVALRGHDSTSFWRGNTYNRGKDHEVFKSGN